MTIIFVSDFPSLNEGTAPFTNGFWRYFKLQLSRAGLKPFDHKFINIFPQPASNAYTFLQPKKPGSCLTIGRGQYVRAEFESALSSFRTYCSRTQANLIVTCGDIATSVLTGDNRMDFSRGRVTTSLPAFNERKVLPVYHPRTVLADLSQEPILAADLRKAGREHLFPEVRRPRRLLHIRPTIDDLELFWQAYLQGPSPIYSVDIETIGAEITCVGVAPTIDRALVIPFFDEEQKDGNYWRTAREERIAWQFVRRILNNMNARTLGQNFTYDVQYFLSRMGIPVRNWTDDTMVLHHSLQPEMRKGLGFLASIYTDELPWKGMHHYRADDRTGKKEDL